MPSNSSTYLNHHDLEAYLVPGKYRNNISLCNWFVRLTNRFHVAVRLFSNRLQLTSKCGKNKRVAHEAQPSVSLMFWRKPESNCLLGSPVGLTPSHRHAMLCFSTLSAQPSRLATSGDKRSSQVLLFQFHDIGAG